MLDQIFAGKFMGWATCLRVLLLSSVALPGRVGSSYLAKEKAKKANILFLLTDDQDRQLGSMAVLPSVEKYVTGAGANVTNMFVNTPICCPSRSTLFSGRYNHNLRAAAYPEPGSKDLCMFMNVSLGKTDYWDNTFARGLKLAGYTTGPVVVCSARCTLPSIASAKPPRRLGGGIVNFTQGHSGKR